MQRFRSFRAWRIAGRHKSAEADKSVVDAARSSARPAVSYIERSILSLYMGNVESEKGRKDLSLRQAGQLRIG